MLRLVLLSVFLLAGAVQAQQANTGTGGTVRVLDKTTGITQDIALRNGDRRRVGLLGLHMTECRYNGLSDYAGLEVFYREQSTPVFRGWMMSSSPALNPMNHPRFDVWLLRCSRS